MRTKRFPGAWLLLALALTACSQRTAGTAQTTTMLEASRAKSYHSISQLARDSTAVVRAQASNRFSVEVIDQVPFTVTTMLVTEVLRGSVNGRTIQLRQLGGPEARLVGDPGIVTPNSAYLLFVMPFELKRGQTTGQYVVVGGSAGLFQDRNGIFERLDKESTDLPPMVSLEALRAMLGST